MAKQQNITKVYEKIFTIKEMLTEAVNTAMEVANDSEGFGGEVSRVITGQLRQDFIPAIQKYIDDKDTHASMSSLIGFLDSVPLAWIRTGPQEDPDAAVSAADTFPGDQTQQQASPAPAPAASPMLPGQTTPNAGVKQESAILKGNSKLRETLKREWQESQKAVTSPAELSFAALMEGYKKDPLSFESFDENQDRMFDLLLGNAASTTTRREKLNEDILAGPYKVREDVGGMEDWKKLTSYDDPFDVSTMEGEDLGMEHMDAGNNANDPNVVDEIAGDMSKAHDL